jgi:predicted GH43/DUF377 family glycosyl hydrolase
MAFEVTKDARNVEETYNYQNDQSLARWALENGGNIHPLIIPSNLTNGLGLMNPSIINIGGKLIINIRSTNYTFYHSERKLFQHQWGPLTYLHPENDMHLRTWNYYVEVDKDFNISRFNKIDTSRFDTYEPRWDFVGLEDARLIQWDGRLLISGVRRDTTAHGQGRMEISEIEVREDEVVETYRSRIEPPNDKNSYCEKNWMPVLDKPWHYVKWSNPTEVVKVFPEKNDSETVFLDEDRKFTKDPRGGSQVIEYKDHYLALTHDVDLFTSEVKRKDGVYRHRFLLWDKNWNLVSWSNDFSLMNGHTEFSCGMCHYEGRMIITFGFQDNAAYILEVPYNVIDKLIGV